MGLEPDDDKEMRILNRVSTWGQCGVKYEPDARHVDIALQELPLNGSYKCIVTVGDKTGPLDVRVENSLSSNKAIRYRALTARGIYLAQDRSDTPSVVKELNRAMSSPTLCNWDELKKEGRCLVKHLRVISDFPYRTGYSHIQGYVDTDHVGWVQSNASVHFRVCAQARGTS